MFSNKWAAYLFENIQSFAQNMTRLHRQTKNDVVW